MNPRQAQTWAKILTRVNILFFLLALILPIRLAVNLSYAKTANQAEKKNTLPPPKKPLEPTLPMFSPCWETQVLETPPPKQPSAVPQPPEVKQPPVAPLKLPYEYVGCAVHKQAQKSFAFLRDQRTGQQLLVYEGYVLPDTTYIVKSITFDIIQVQCGDTIVTLERPKPWLTLGQPKAETSQNSNTPGSSEKPSLATHSNKIIVEENPVLAQYGLLSQDQIISVAGKRVYDQAQLETAIAGVEKSLTQIAVLRKGRMLEVILPSEVVSNLLQKTKK